jgi:S-DNA-T family DNA segregation ATPase FtsK/SpoIIIE
MAKNQDKYFKRLLGPVGSAVLLVGSGLLAPVFVPMATLVFGVCAYDYLRAYWFRTDLDRFFEESGFGIGDKVPEMIDKHDFDGGYVCEYKMPAGIDLDDLEKYKASMELYLNAHVVFELGNKSVFITVNEKRLAAHYDYKLYESENPLEVCIGQTLAGPLFFDFEKGIHLLIASETGGGKSCLLRSMITSFILSKHSVDLHLVDFQRVELGIFKKCRRVKDYCDTPEKFHDLLIKLKAECDKRLKLFEDAGVVNIKKYNKTARQKLKYHIVLVDEFAALMESDDNKAIKTLLMVFVAQCRKCGIAVCLVTQRPSAKVLDGDIKANIPATIALKTRDWRNSQLILDESGAERLRGAGHALLKHVGVTEFQGMLLDEDEARDLVKHTFVEPAPPPKLEVIKNVNVPRPANTSFR